jgi:hypothetical protein
MVSPGMGSIHEKSLASKRIARYLSAFRTASVRRGQVDCVNALKLLVEPRGFEPLTSAVRLRRSPN